jgi:hypothetical protein
MWTSPPFARNSVAGFSMVVYLAVISASEKQARSPQLSAEHDRHGCLIHLDPDPFERAVDVSFLQELT